jgi:hypothetical protein
MKSYFEVESIRVVDESRSEGERQFALEVPDCAVDEGGRHCDGEPPENKNTPLPKSVQESMRISSSIKTFVRFVHKVIIEARGNTQRLFCLRKKTMCFFLNGLVSAFCII